MSQDDLTCVEPFDGRAAASKFWEEITIALQKQHRRDQVLVLW